MVLLAEEISIEAKAVVRWQVSLEVVSFPSGVVCEQGQLAHWLEMW